MARSPSGTSADLDLVGGRAGLLGELGDRRHARRQLVRRPLVAVLDEHRRRGLTQVGQVEEAEPRVHVVRHLDRSGEVEVLHVHRRLRTVHASPERRTRSSQRLPEVVRHRREVGAGHRVVDDARHPRDASTRRGRRRRTPARPGGSSARRGTPCRSRERREVRLVGPTQRHGVDAAARRASATARPVLPCPPTIPIIRPGLTRHPRSGPAAPAAWRCPSSPAPTSRGRAPCARRGTAAQRSRASPGRG